MRTPLIAGNWKMNKTIEEARILVGEMIRDLEAVQNVDKVLCPPFPSLLPVAALLQGTNIHLGAQNMYWEEKGAFTGEVAPSMVAELCRYVIIGHSERRAYFGETNETVNKKLAAAQKANLIPIVCVGETLTDYEAKQTLSVVRQQILGGIKALQNDFASRIVIAYEPVWAIGTGKASTGENANDVIRDVIRPAIGELYGQNTADAIRVLYGGSVTASNAAEFFRQPEIDGALVGGASLKAGEFIAITQAAVN